MLLLTQVGEVFCCVPSVSQTIDRGTEDLPAGAAYREWTVMLGTAVAVCCTVL